jgi:hypothetical protein
LIPEKNLKA